MYKKILKFFDKLEDRVRVRLSHYPILYAIIGGVGTVLFWRGVWHTADFVSAVYLPIDSNTTDYVNLSPVDGLISFFIGLFMLLITGLYVATFIGDHIILSGLRGDKKITERTEAEVKEDVDISKKVHDELHSISKRLEEIEKKIGDKKSG